jgi:hypothetical protein
LALADSRETESSTEYGSGIGYETKRRNAGSLAEVVAGGGSKKTRYSTVQALKPYYQLGLLDQ